MTRYAAMELIRAFDRYLIAKDAAQYSKDSPLRQTQAADAHERLIRTLMETL